MIAASAEPGKGYCEIPLHGRLAAGRVALVDPQDIAALSIYRWHLSAASKMARPTNPGYARCMVHGKWLSMHRLIMQPDAGLEVDHINGNGLDNRRANLRVVDHGTNQRNTALRSHNKSGYRGVHWCNQVRKWRAQIVHAGAKHWLGDFATALEAAKAYEAGRDALGLLKAEVD